MKWIKASERLPGWNVITKWKMSPVAKIEECTVKTMLGWSSAFLQQLEWLDESNTDDVNYKEKYEKCINVIKRFDAGIIGMYDL